MSSAVFVAQSSIELQTPSVTLPQVLLAVLVLAFAAAALLAAHYLSQFVGLPEEERRHARALAMQLDAKTPARLRLPITTNFDAKRYLIRDLWTLRDDSPGEGHRRRRDEPPTVRGALGELHGVLIERWSETLTRVPLYSVRLVEEAVVLLVLGAIAVVSLEQWEAAASATTPTPDVGAVFHDLHYLTVTVLEAGLELLHLFPYGGFVWSLLFAHGILLYDWLYHHWFILSVILVLGAIAIAYLDQYVDETDARLISDRRQLAGRVAAATVSIWLAAVGPTAIGQVAGLPHIGAILGFLVAVIAAIAFATLGTRWLIGEIKAAADWYVEDKPSRHIAAYLLVRRVWGVFAVIGATLIPVYLVVILADGRLFAVAGAFSNASTEIQLLAATVIAAAVIAFVLVTREAWPDLAAALRSKLGEESMRLALLGRGAPLLVMAVVYLIAVGFNLPVGIAVLGAVVAATATRGLYLLSARLKWRLQNRDDPEQRPAMVYIEAYQLEDADGQDHYVAKLNGERIARAALSPLVDEVVEQATSLQESGEYTATFGRYHADNLLEHGIVDEQASERSMKREITASYEQLFDQYGGRVPKEAASDELDRYPDQHVATRKRELRTMGAEDWRLAERDGYLLRV